MRRYIRTEDLALTLRDLMLSRDPQLRQVYKEVLLYRTTNNAKRYPRAARMLFMPVKLYLIALNIFLCLSALILLPTPVISFTPLHFFQIKLAVCMILICTQLIWLRYILPDVRACRPYLHIDEMMKRKILILKKTAAASEAKK